MMKTRWLFSLLFLCNLAYGMEPVVDEVTFDSHGATLSGSIVWSAETDLDAAIVFVHGSGEQTRNLNLAKYFAKQGIAALVYDKRGVGQSGGKYERKQSVSGMNISLLADDAKAALKALSLHPKVKGLKLGLTGISQAGWIVPLAAQRSDLADFMVIWSGPVCKVSEEDIFSKYTVDSDAKKVPSYAEALAARKRPYIWPDFLGVDSDPSTSLAKLTMPGLWLFGQQDGSVPVDLSIQRLEQQIDSGKPYEYALFSGVGHNNIPQTIDTAISWIKRVNPSQTK